MFISIRTKLGLILFVGVFMLTLSMTAAQQYFAYQEFKSYVTQTAQSAVSISIHMADQWVTTQLNAMDSLRIRLEQQVDSNPFLEREVQDYTNNHPVVSIGINMLSGYKINYPLENGLSAVPNIKQTTQNTFTKSHLVNFDIPNERVVFESPLYGPNQWSVKGQLRMGLPLNGLIDAIASIALADVEALQPVNLKSGDAVLAVQTKGVPAEKIPYLVEQTLEDGAIHSGVTWAGQHLIVAEYLEPHGFYLLYTMAIGDLLKPLLLRAIIIFCMTAAGLWFLANISWSILSRFIKRIEDMQSLTQSVSAGNFDINIPSQSNDELGRLATNFNHMGVELKTYMSKLEKTVREKEAITKELAIAAELQMNALPKDVPHIPELEIAARSFPAETVGGDYYDFIFPTGNKVGFIIADAAGKGFPGSLYMSNSRSIFRVIAMNESSPAQMLQKTNHHIALDSTLTEGMFITYISGIYDPLRKKLTYSNAGHFPPLLYKKSSGEFQSMVTGGMPIGIMDDEEYAEEEVAFECGDILVLYTDGFIEAMNESGQMFGIDQLGMVIKRLSHMTANEILLETSKAIGEFVGQAPQHDDMTIVIVKVK
ncbi:MAG: serine phosphatase RsbU (regulator of sigma subunit) [Candidatus Omnitrophota bacterium]|jgi:serine phosphatase RsbU (regulator of sigma subunit)